MAENEDQRGSEVRADVSDKLRLLRDDQYMATYALSFNDGAVSSVLDGFVCFRGIKFLG